MGHKICFTSLVLLFLPFLISCDKFYEEDIVITNEAIDTIIVFFNERESGSTQNISISPGETKTIFHFRLGGKCQKTYGKNNCTPSQVDSLGHFFSEFAITKNDTISNTDFSDINQWTFTAVDGLGTYKTSVNESDF